MKSRLLLFINIFVTSSLNAGSIEDVQQYYPNCDSLIITEKLIENDTINNIKTYNFTSYINNIPTLEMLCISNKKQENLYISIREESIRNSSLIIPFIKPTLQYASCFMDIRNLAVINMSLPDSIIIEISGMITYSDYNKDISHTIEKKIEHSDFTIKINGILRDFGLCINKINVDHIYFINKDVFIKSRNLKYGKALPTKILQLELFYGISEVKTFIEKEIKTL